MTTAAETQVPLAVLGRHRLVLVLLHWVARPNRQHRWLVGEMGREVLRPVVDHQRQTRALQPVEWLPVVSPVRASVAATSAPVTIRM